MKITNPDWALLSLSKSSAIANDIDKENGEAQITKIEKLRAQAQDASQHDIALSKESYEVFRHLKTVAPQDRIKLEGIPTEYLQSMTDEQYVDALRVEATKYSRLAYDLQNEADGSPERSGRTTQPSFNPAEATGVLQTYVNNLTETIAMHNQLHRIYTSDGMRASLEQQYGKDSADQQMAKNTETLSALEQSIKMTMQSLNVLFTFSGSKPIASEENGIWSFNPSAAFHNGSSFSIDDRGNVALTGATNTA